MLILLTAVHLSQRLHLFNAVEEVKQYTNVEILQFCECWQL